VAKKWVYLSSAAIQDLAATLGREPSLDEMKVVLGGKGAGLADMTSAGVPVPPVFSITTEACMAYINAGFTFPPGMWEQALKALKQVEKQTGKKFGDPKNPLLVSVRSGAKFSMPGMMDTILNVGLNDETLQGMVALTGNERFAWDAYRRLIQMFGRTAMGIRDEAFDEVMEELKHEKGVREDTDLTTEDLKELVARFKKVYKHELGSDFPQEPLEQLKAAVEAVFRSWMGNKAISYRRAEKIPDDLGTAVNVQTMVFGNMGWDSGTGVLFTRDPATGESRFYGDYLLNAQGEDVVAGIRNTKPVGEIGQDLPQVSAQLTEIAHKLERHYRDMQDTEFTVERGTLWMLQTRTGKRTARAAVKIAVDMVNEGLITREQALLRVTPKDVDTFLHPQFDEAQIDKAKAAGRLLASGVNASPGAAVGILAFDADTAEAWGKAGKDVIMIRPETKPDDVHGMIAAQGILTSRGGATAHAAVVARQFGKPAVVGARDLDIDLETREVRAHGKMLKEGDYVSLDGAAGEVYEGQIPTVVPEFEKEVELRTLLEWADAVAADTKARQWPADYKGFPTRGLQVWANADYPKDARRARQYGAQGIGLCRTEHMFFEQTRLPTVQQMILNAEEAQAIFDRRARVQATLDAGKEDGKPLDDVRRGELQADLQALDAESTASVAVQAYKGALDALLPFQRSDFYGIFEAMDGLPVIIRLIDPPLHEFLPGHDELLVKVTEMKTRGESGPELEAAERMLAAVERMQETNPMMGLRGIRLGITYPGITQMQVRAIFEAACEAAKKGIVVKPEVMIPLTGHVNELEVTQKELELVAKEVMEKEGVEVEYKFGTMIEIPRAAVTADEVARLAQFFSFGTNDLTQMTFGYSRDDAERRFLVKYIETGVLKENPFQVLDRDGVGKLVEMGVRLGRQTRPDLEVGICGEHGGDPSSIEFCHLAGLNYVSCSPFRVPVARLAAAQAAIQHKVAKAPAKAKSPARKAPAKAKKPAKAPARKSPAKSKTATRARSKSRGRSTRSRK
jgi:pyruvate,orthophosphate dikinase